MESSQNDFEQAALSCVSRYSRFIGKSVVHSIADGCELTGWDSFDRKGEAVRQSAFHDTLTVNSLWYRIGTILQGSERWTANSGKETTLLKFLNQIIGNNKWSDSSEYMPNESRFLKYWVTPILLSHHLLFPFLLLPPSFLPGTAEVLLYGFTSIGLLSWKGRANERLPSYPLPWKWVIFLFLLTPSIGMGNLLINLGGNYWVSMIGL